MGAEPQKPRFEPPPWEREAFERFQREQEALRAAAELEEALAAVKEAPAEPASPEAAQPVEPGPADASSGEPAVVGGVPQAQVDAMLVRLRGEEPSAQVTNMPLVNGAIAFMVVSGMAILIQGGTLFARARSADAAVTMLGMTMSFIIVLTGIGFLGGAILLFRKYHS